MEKLEEEGVFDQDLLADREFKKAAKAIGTELAQAAVGGRSSCPLEFCLIPKIDSMQLDAEAGASPAKPKPKKRKSDEGDDAERPAKKARVSKGSSKKTERDEDTVMSEPEPVVKKAKPTAKPAPKRKHVSDEEDERNASKEDVQPKKVKRATSTKIAKPIRVVDSDDDMEQQNRVSPKAKVVSPADS